MTRPLSGLLAALCLTACVKHEPQVTTTIDPETHAKTITSRHHDGKIERTTIDLENGGIINTLPLADFTDPPKKPKCLGKEDDSFR